jgi:hypothetical protein
VRASPAEFDTGGGDKFPGKGEARRRDHLGKQNNPKSTARSGCATRIRNAERRGEKTGFYAEARKGLKWEKE